MEVDNKSDWSWVYDLYRIGQVIATESPDQAQRAILNFVVTRFGATSGTVALMNESGSALRIVAGIGGSERFIGHTIPVGQQIMGWVAKEASPLLLNGDVSNDPRFCNLARGRNNAGPMSAMCWPLQVDKRVIGVFSINRCAGEPEFTQTDFAQAGTIINLASLAVENARLQVDQQQRIAELSVMNGEKEQLIRQLQEAQGQLLQSEKMASIGQLAAGVAHEINNPIGYINSNITTLQRYVDDLFKLLSCYQALETAIPPESAALTDLLELKALIDIEFLSRDVQDLMNESREGLARVKQIVHDLKDFSHVDEAAWQWADLHKGLESTLNIVHNELKYKADIVRDYGDLPPVECLASQINQVFMNLLVNAAHAIEERGTITLRSRLLGDEVCMEIADTGRGIDRDHLSRIFDPFFTTKPIGQGTGLGLSLSYNIINKHGGRIEVDSTIGQGTTFRVFLPVSQGNRAAGSEIGHSDVEQTAHVANR